MFLYQHASDQIADAAAITLSTGTAPDADSPLTNVVDPDPEEAAYLLPSGGTVAIDLDFGSASAFGLVSAPSTPLPAGGTLTVKFSNASNFSTGVSRLLSAPAVREDGWPVNIFTDASDLGTNYRYVRYLFESLGSAALWVGLLWVGSQTRSLSPTLIDVSNETLEESRPDEVHIGETGPGDVWDRGITERMLSIDVETQPDSTNADATAAKALLWAWWRSAKGRVLPFAIVPDHAVNELLIVRFAPSLSLSVALAGQLYDVVNTTLRFTEVGGGVPS